MSMETSREVSEREDLEGAVIALILAFPKIEPGKEGNGCSANNQRGGEKEGHFSEGGALSIGRSPTNVSTPPSNLRGLKKYQERDEHRDLYRDIRLCDRC